MFSFQNSDGSHSAKNGSPESYYSSAQSWVSSVTVCGNSDLAASGAGNGAVRLWVIESDTKSIQTLCDLPLVSYTHSLNVALFGIFIDYRMWTNYAGVTQHLIFGLLPWSYW